MTTVLYDASWGNGTRRCGDCTLCCKLIPVHDINKPGGQRCQHQRRTGCRIYERRPESCQFWNCRWLANLDTADMSRPDRVHYVIDVLPDHIVATYGHTGERIPIPAIQVWIDPDYPEAHRDPALRAFLARRAEEGYAAIIRSAPDDGFVLFAPAMANDGEWHEMLGAIDPTRNYDLQQTMDVLSGNAPV